MPPSPSVPARACSSLADTPPAWGAPESRLSTAGSAKAPPAAVRASEPAHRAACAGGKRGTSPSSAGPLRLIQKLPREAMRLFLRSSSSSSSAPARPPCPACLCSGISRTARCGAGLCRCVWMRPSLAFPWLGHPCGLVPAPEPLGLRPSWRHPAQPPRSGSGGTGRCCWQRGSLREASPARSPPAPPSPLPSPHKRGPRGLCSPKGSGGAGSAVCGAGSSLQQNTRFFRVLFKASLPPSSTSGALPTLGASGGVESLPPSSLSRALPLSARV